MLQSNSQKVLSLLMLFMLALTGSMEVKAQPSEWRGMTYNDDVRYSQWIINSRINDFYANSTHVSFGKYSAKGVEEEAPIIVVKNKKTVLDYVPGLVAKAIVENVKLNATYTWAAPWYYSMKSFGDTYYNAVTNNGTSGKSQDDLNGIKMFFALKDLTASGAKYENSTTNGHCISVMGDARTGLNNLNKNYIIGGANSGVSEDDAKALGMYGGWFHKSDYKDQMWCDGLYMGPALLAQLINEYGDYEKINGNAGEDDWDLITRLFTISWNQLYDSKTGLLYHAFTANPKDDASAYWEGISNTDPKVYHSAAFWGRACGWYFLALVDILEQMDKAELTDTDNYNTLKGYLNNLADGLANYQDAKTGCWYQVLDEKDSNLEGNYLESSCTAIFAAAYLKGTRLHYFTSDYTAIAKKAYKGCVNQFMMFDNKDEAQLIHCCASAGLGGSAHRSGSRSYYISGSDVTQRNTYTEGKVLGGFILAATEYERMYQSDKAILFSTDLKDSYSLENSGTISIEAFGADGAQITYQWYRNGVAVDGETSATIAPTASGDYYCKATSGTTTITSSTAQVIVAGDDTFTPEFTTNLPATATATEGVAKTLTVAADHVDGYQWYSNTTASNTGGQTISGATSASYTFTPNATGTLYYYCVATNSKATDTQSVASNVCTVTVSEATTYTVTFDATTNGGTCGTASLTQASSGASITLPTATKSGYTFNGWYTASTGGTLRGTSGASYTPTADETLYAQFTPAGGGGTESISWAITTNSFTVTPTITPSSGAHLSNASTSISLTGLSSTSSSKDGYCKPFYGTVVDFNASDDFASISFDVADGYTFTPSSVGMTVYSHGTGNFKYKMIISDSQGTPITVTSNEIQPSSGGEATITFAADAFTGKAFEGTVTIKLYVYNYSNSSTGKRTYIKSPITISGTTAAKGGSSTYTVSYNMNGHGEAIADVTNVTALPDPLPTPEATGYTFGGWYTDSGLTSAAVAGASISADTELFAKWTANTYSVHFDANGGEGSMTNESFTYGTAKALTANAFTRTGYKFDGWATSANGAKVYDNSQSVSNLTATNDGTVDLYAHWTEKAAATVSINPVSGNVTVGSTLNISSYVTAGNSTGAISYSTGDASKATVTNAGVITGEAVGSATITISQAEDANYKAGSVTFTVTVNAAPVPTTNYTVKFWNGETQFGDSQSIEEGSTVSAPATSPTKDGYTFKGWALSEGSTARVLFPYPVYADVNFYAVWSNSTSGGGGEEEEIFKATATTALKVTKETSNNNLSEYATIAGGSMYANNGETSDKDMIKNKGNIPAFELPNSKTIFRVTLNKALQAGDKINADIWARTDTEVGLWLSTSSTRPKSAKATMTLATASTAAWGSLPEYTVTTGDGICGETTFYIHRSVGSTVDFTDFTITREGHITLETVSDYDDFESYEGENKTVTFKRNFTEGKWTTLVLPFSVNATQLSEAFEYANDCELANIQSMTVNEQGTGSISYVTTSHITANTPILAKIKPNDGLSGKEGFTANEYVFTGVPVVNSETATATSNDGNVTMYGVYENTARSGFSSLADEEAYFLYNGKFYDFSWLSNMTPFTAYIVPQTTSGNALKGLTFEEDSATGIINLNVNPNRNSLSTGEGWGESFNLAGQKVGKEYKGMVIKKGKKVIKK